MTKASPDYPFTLEEFHAIYSKVPRLTVEVVVKSDKGVLLSLRDIEPCKGMWHIPGGTVFLGESLVSAVRRVARRELGVEVRGEPKFLDYIEYPEFYKQGFGHALGMAFLIDYDGEPKSNQESAELKWFRELPPNTIAEQSQFINSKVL
jgi:ADP-ribose pyrophosphatase YjhB (NUDIX family)